MSVQIPGYCTGVALFTGTLTVAKTSTQTSGDTNEIQMAPVALAGTLTCVGLPLSTMTVSLTDYNDANYDVFGPLDSSTLITEIIY